MAKAKKQKADKRRARKKKQAKSKHQGIPKILQRDPGLREALNYRHPLMECRINTNWQEHGMASVLVARSAPTGIVYSVFLVDVLGVGLKDVMGDYGVSENHIREHKFLKGLQGGDLVACDHALAFNLIHDGLAWAREWKFKPPKDYKVWMRLLEPRKNEEPDFSGFGRNGKPLPMLSEDDLDIIMDADFDSSMLRDPIVMGNKEIPQNTLARLGDIKGTLINFSRGPEFKEDFEMARKSRFGKEKKPKDKGEWINFQDWFILESELMSGETIIDRFLETYQDEMSRDVRELIKGWKQVIEGLFEIKDRLKNGYLVKNLINERVYEAFATNISEPLIDLFKGDFFIGRIVSARGVHIFSGAFSPIPLDGNDRVRNKMYQVAARMQMENPAKALADNPEKLQKSREAVRKMYADFISYFGKDEVFGTGKEIRQCHEDFFDHQVFKMQDPETGLTKAEEFEKRTGRHFKPLKLELPQKLLRSKDAAMLCDPVESLTFLEEYRLFVEVFDNPEMHLGMAYAEDVVMSYLESDTISDVPFRRAAKRYPENFKTVIDYYAQQEGFTADDLEDLMQAFKPESYGKLPSIVVVLDEEIANARLL
ncbi:MAG: hypothetical protein DRH90_18935 [Deltaproteobacteria bacterium]|nr:MAG: hypothetical protein DRH90_18935 [Deltaproteobacteria bacterium]